MKATIINLGPMERYNMVLKDLFDFGRLVDVKIIS